MALSSGINLKVRNEALMNVRTSMVPAASVTLYQGAFVAIDGSGNLVIPTGSNQGMGFVRSFAQGASLSPDGIADACVVEFGYTVEITIATATVASVGDTVYATSDNVFTMTPNTSIVGQIVDVVDATNDIYAVQVTCLA